MAQSIVRPAVTDFLDFTVHNREMGELLVYEQSRLNGMRLIDSGIRKELDVNIMPIPRENGEMQFKPSSESIIRSGDR